MAQPRNFENRWTTRIMGEVARRFRAEHDRQAGAGGLSPRPWCVLSCAILQRGRLRCLIYGEAARYRDYSETVCQNRHQMDNAMRQFAGGLHGDLDVFARLVHDEEEQVNQIVVPGTGGRQTLTDSYLVEQLDARLGHRLEGPLGVRLVQRLDGLLGAGAGAQLVTRLEARVAERAARLEAARAAGQADRRRSLRHRRRLDGWAGDNYDKGSGHVHFCANQMRAYGYKILPPGAPPDEAPISMGAPDEGVSEQVWEDSALDFIAVSELVLLIAGRMHDGLAVC